MGRERGGRWLGVEGVSGERGHWSGGEDGLKMHRGTYVPATAEGKLVQYWARGARGREGRATAGRAAHWVRWMRERERYR